MKKVLKHFSQVDPVLHGLIVKEKIELKPLEILTDWHDFFPRLCDDIISQQLAGKAATAIVNRFFALFPNKKPTPAGVLKLSDQAIRDIGTSWAKARYLKNLAEATVQKKIKFDQFHKLSNEEIIRELTQVKGIGPWTAEMFLMFSLGREDVFSFGDLGLKNSFMKIYKMKDGKRLKSRMVKITALWTPYRSYASVALWRLIDKKA